MKQPVVAVVLPVRNGEPFVRESIESVLQQRFEEFELLVLDDASTDATPAIVAAMKDSRIRYLRSDEHLGLFRALTRGFHEATAEWVHLWAHDDRMLPNCLKRQLAFHERHPSAAMSFCDFAEIDETGARTGHEAELLRSRAGLPAVFEASRAAFLFFCYGCLPGNISTVMVRRSVWSAVGGFQTGIQHALDYEMWVRISRRHAVGYVPEVLVELRAHGGQLSKVGHRQVTTIDEELPVFDELISRLVDHVDIRDLRQFWRANRGRQHAHWMARAALRLDYAAVRQGLHSLRRYGCSVPAQFAVWLLSLNGRIFTESPDAYYQRHAVTFAER